MVNRLSVARARLAPYSLLVAATALAAAPLTAQPLAPEPGELITELDIGAEIPPLRGVSFLDQQRAQAPAAITVLDRAFIEAAPVTSLTDLFRLVPGFQSYLAAAGEGRVNYHVMADSYPRRMEVKVDGRSVYESIFSTVIWSSLGLQLQDIERIEIVRGSNAASEGSNAFIGSVNIVTRSPLNSSGRSVTARTGSDGIGALAGSQSGDIGAVSYRLAASYQREDGFADIAEGMDDAMEAKSIDLRAVWMPSAWDTVDFHVGFSDDRIGSGGDEDFATYNYRGSYQSLSWQRVLSNGDEVGLQFYHNRLRTGSDEPYKLLSGLLIDGVAELDESELPFGLSRAEVVGLLQTEAGLRLGLAAFYPATTGTFDSVSDQLIQTDFASTDSDRWDLSVNRTMRRSPALRISTGVGLRYDSGTSPMLFSDHKKRDRSSGRLFGHVEWQPKSRWTFNAGGILELPSTHDAFGSARLGVNYRDNSDGIWRLTASHGERLGSILEHNQEVELRVDDIIFDAVIRSGEDLTTEKLNAYELGYSRSWWQRRLQLDMRGFREEYRDLIGSRREPFAEELDLGRRVGVRRNVTNLSLKGYELEVGLRLGRRWLINATATRLDLSGYTHKYLDRVEQYQPQDERTPRDNRSLLVSYQSGNGWLFSLSSVYQGELSWIDGNRVGSYLRTDLKAARSWTVGGGQLKLSVTAQNIGEDYAEFYLTNQFQTRYIVSAEYRQR